MASEASLTRDSSWVSFGEDIIILDKWGVR